MKTKHTAVTKFISTAAAVSLVLTLPSSMVWAEGNDNNTSGTTDSTNTNDTSSLIRTKDESDGKEETVYIITDASGKTQKTIVSDRLKNISGASSIKDASDLSDIENVNGDEDYTQNSDGTITWNAEGKDIYYQGTTAQTAPVAVAVSYRLDGKDISAEDLAGKSGHVIIRFDYTNNAEKTVEINGKNRTVKVPFAMISGVILPQDNFSNVKVTNGKVMSEGKNNIVMGMAFPGLKESLDLEDDADLKDRIGDVEIPEYVEIEADATDFKLEETMTVASAELLSSVDADIDTSDIQNDLNRLQDGADDLLQGTKDLKDGTEKLKNGANDLSDGASTLKNGTGDLLDGANKLNDGASQVSDGAAKLDSGVDTAVKGSKDLADGASQVSTGASSLKDGAAALAAGAERVDNGAQAVLAGAQQLQNGLTGTDPKNPSILTGVKALEAGTSALGTGLDLAMDGLDKVDGGLAFMQTQLPVTCKCRVDN